VARRHLPFPTRRSSDLPHTQPEAGLAPPELSHVLNEVRAGSHSQRKCLEFYSNAERRARRVSARSCASRARTPLERVSIDRGMRSEEHTSELQSRENLV